MRRFHSSHRTKRTVRDSDPLGPVDEFRDMVKALHRAGIEVILDVVFNHTAEGDHRRADAVVSAASTTQPITSSKAVGEWYANYTGCGNTLNANHPIVRRMIVDSLRYWVEEMHVDGFRFDLASILTRDASGTSAAKSARALGYRVETRRWRAPSSLPRHGTPPGYIRLAASSAMLGESGTANFATTFATSFAASLVRSVAWRTGWSAAPSIYGHKQREAEQSVNFVTCHDGFTLNDLVSYNQKHNEANGEDNRDGANDNRSWNCGVEGPNG